MSFNPYARLRGIFPQDRLQVGSVLAIDAGQVVIELVDGSRASARGVATVGERVYVRAGVVEGVAPALPVVEIEI